MCVACLREQIDISEGIPKQGTLYFCRNCERYLQPPATWTKASLESRELLSVCLKKIKGLNKVRLIDAGFVWTEPHSKRIKVKLTIQQEVMNGAVLQQTFVVEFTVCGQMCDDCHRVEAKDYWRACVQVRQKTSHKKTLFYLEQLILKHRAHASASSIKQVHEGLDFYYQHQQEAKKMVEFLQAVVPSRCNNAKELISHDQRSNIYNYKYTSLVEIVPICKDNIVCLAPKLAQQLGNLGQFCVVTRVTQIVQLIDPSTCATAELRAEVFWRSPFKSLCGPRQLTPFIVMQVELITDRKHCPGLAAESQRHQLADVWVVRESEFGKNEEQLHCRSHLGHLLNPFDYVLGFDMRNANINDANFDNVKTDKIPDVILVKKMYGDSGKRASKRKWTLKHLEGEVEGTDDGSETHARDYNDFLEDLEEDPAYRQNVNIYKGKDSLPVEREDTDDEEYPRVSLAEMLEDLHIAEDATGGEGAEMIE